MTQIIKHLPSKILNVGKTNKVIIFLRLIRYFDLD